MAIIKNNAFRKLMETAGLGHIALVKGDGYFYIIGQGTGALQNTSIYVNNFSDMTAEEWVEAILDLFPKKSTRGGARKGAGRPSKGLVNMGMRIKVEDAEFLRKTANEVGITIAEVIHILIEDYVTNVHHEFSRFDAEQ